ncbi:hypothetical protein ACFSJQ_23730 [Vibrio olivae]
MKLLTVSLSLLLLLSPVSHAQDAGTFETSNTPISEFVAWAAREMNQPIVLGRGVSGTVSFTAPNLQPDEYLSFFFLTLFFMLTVTASSITMVCIRLFQWMNPSKKLNRQASSSTT